MRKYLIVFFILIVSGCSNVGNAIEKEVYLLPNGFAGCAYIVYNIEDAPPLELIEGVIEYNFDEEGFMLTSSPEDFGWEGKDHSGFFQSEYYYVDGIGNYISEIPLEEIGFSSLGSMDQNEQVIVTRFATQVKNNDAICNDFEPILKKLDIEL